MKNFTSEKQLRKHMKYAPSALSDYSVNEVRDMVLTSHAISFWCLDRQLGLRFGPPSPGSKNRMPPPIARSVTSP